MARPPMTSDTTALLLALALLGTACATPDAPQGASQDATVALEGKLVLTGSSTVAPLASEIAHRFEELNPGTRIDVQSGGSSRGIADTRSGVADIGMASRALDPEEADLRSITIAHDGICLIVHRDNPLTALDDAQVVAIYTGVIDDWAELGGPPGPITVVNKAAGRATLEVFLDHFGLAAEAIDADVVIGDNQQGIKTVAGTPGAIGYVSIGAADYAARQGTPIKLLAAGAVAPTTDNVASGRFPITRPLNLVLRDPAIAGPPSALGQAFIDFARSSEVHDLIAALFFVPAGDPATDPAAISTTHHPSEGPAADGTEPQG